MPDTFDVPQAPADLIIVKDFDDQSWERINDRYGNDVWRLVGGGTQLSWRLLVSSHGPLTAVKYRDPVPTPDDFINAVLNVGSAEAARDIIIALLEDVKENLNGA